MKKRTTASQEEDLYGEDEAGELLSDEDDDDINKDSMIKVTLYINKFSLVNSFFFLCRQKRKLLQKPVKKREAAKLPNLSHEEKRNKIAFICIFYMHAYFFILALLYVLFKKNLHLSYCNFKIDLEHLLPSIDLCVLLDFTLFDQ